MKYETIIMIEYYDNIPNSVLTETGVYDFELCNDDWLMFHQSEWGYNFSCENGKKIIPINGIFVEPERWKIWIENGYSFNIQEGVILLKKPLMVLWYDNIFHNNPFVYGDEVDDIYYCEKCDLFFNDDGCPEHGYELEEENVEIT